MTGITDETAEQLAEGVQKLASETKTANLLAYAAVLQRQVDEQEAALGPEGGTTIALQRDRELLGDVMTQVQARLTRRKRTFG